MNPVRIAIVGCGKVAQLHGEALDGLPEADLIGACDPLPERAEQFAARFGARPFTDLAGMLNWADLEAVVLCTPHPLHCDAAVAAANAGKHVLVEKPLAPTVADCDAMIDAAGRNRVLLGVVSQRRFYEPVVRMKDAIDAGKIGTPVLGTIVMLSWRDQAYYSSDPWRGKWSTEGGGVLINQAPHQLDILQWLMGPVEEISGYWGNLNHPYIEVEDTAVATLRFAGGGLGSIVTSLSQKPGIYTKVHIHGSNGASVGVQTDSGATFVAGMTGIAAPPFTDLWTVPGEEHMLSQFQAQDEQLFATINPLTHYHRLQLKDFCYAVRERRQPAVPGVEGRKVVSMIEAIYRSSNEARPIRFD